MAQPKKPKKQEEKTEQERPFRAQITLHDSYAHVVYQEPGGAGWVSKEVMVNELTKALAGVATGTGVLPRNTLFQTQRGGNVYLGVYVPPTQYNLMTPNGTYAVPLPGLIFTGHKRTYELYALDAAGWPEENAKLFHPPTPNVYDDGHICQGEMKFPQCTSSNIWDVWEKYMVGSYFTGHLSSKRCQSESHIFNLWEKLDKEKTASFPVEELVPTRATLKSLAEVTK